MRGQPVSGCAGVGTFDDAFQSLDYLDQCGHVGDFVEGWSFELGQQGADLLLGHAIEDGFHASQTACGGFQHVEDLLTVHGFLDPKEIPSNTALADKKLDVAAYLDGLWVCSFFPQPPRTSHP